MRYFHIPPDQIRGDQAIISGSELHHLVNVVRLREGDLITILDGVGGTYEVELVSLKADTAIGHIKSHHQDRPTPLKISLFVGLPKADKMDLVVQKATELGAYRIVPVLCHRSVPRLPQERAERRIARWRQISIEACKQSHRAFFPIISDFMKFNDVLSAPGLIFIFMPPKSGERKLKDVLKQPPRAEEAGILIGPEGGFTEDEVGLAVSAGSVPVFLGKNILRTETAAIAALAVMLYELL